jgi:hypothetical protein
MHGYHKLRLVIYSFAFNRQRNHYFFFCFRSAGFVVFLFCWFSSIQLVLLLFTLTMSRCHLNRYNPYGYLDLSILSEYTEYANSLCEFLLNTITLDYVVRTSIRNNRTLIHRAQQTNDTCISLYNINLDTDYLVYEETMRRLW